MKRLALMLLVLTGCTKSRIADFAMASAPHHAHERRTLGKYQLLAGDMHCHVLPPDAPYHVSRGLPETVKLAEDEGLDFVVLTPHVERRFFLDPEGREWVRRTQRVLRARIDQLGTHDVIVIPGMEYTDYEFGHVGLSFADVNAVLDAVPLATLEAHPEQFFETWETAGGLTTINHPFLYGLPKVPIAEFHYDLSWRGYTAADFAHLPPEVRWLTEHADAVETWNETVGHTRDRWFFDDSDWTMRQGTHLVDRLAKKRERRVAPVGGTDSHGSWLRPTTWVLALERTPAAIHDAIVSGRTCVRGPEACALEVDAHEIGSAVTSKEGVVTARTGNEPTTYFVNGELAGSGPSARLRVSGSCSVVRAQVGESMSAPIYVDCAWAAEPSRAQPIITGPPFSSAR